MARVLPILLFSAALGLGAPSAASSEILRVEALSETYGQRFCQLYYRTSLPCATRLVLIDGSQESLITGKDDQPDRDHRLLLPLALDRRLSYSIVLPDGSRVSPRKLRTAAAKAPKIRVRQEPASDGGLDLLASIDADATWSLAIRRGSREATFDGGARRSPSARFHIPRLGPDEVVDSAVITARTVDSIATRAVGSLVGNRRLAESFIGAIQTMDVDSLHGLASSRDSTEALLRKAYQERLGFALSVELLEAAASRGASIVDDETLDAETIRIPFSHGMVRLGNLDWLARLRGWQPVTGVESHSSELMTAFWPEKPPKESVQIYKLKPPVLAPLALWPGTLGGGVQAASFARLSDETRAEELGEIIVQKTHPFVLMLAASNRIQLAAWDSWKIDPSWLADPNGRVTLYLRVLNLEPQYAMYLRLNDVVMLPFRNRPDTFRGSADLRLTPENFLDFLERQANWIACSTTARFLTAGTNSWVATTENLVPNKRSISLLFIDELRVGFEPSSGAGRKASR